MFRNNFSNGLKTLCMLELKNILHKKHLNNIYRFSIKIKDWLKDEEQGLVK